MESVASGAFQLGFGVLLGALAFWPVAAWLVSLSLTAKAPAPSLSSWFMRLLRAFALSPGPWALAIVCLVSFIVWTNYRYASLFVTGLFIAVGLSATWNAHLLRKARERDAA